MTTQREEWTIRPWEAPESRLCLAPDLHDAMQDFLTRWNPDDPHLADISPSNLTAFEIVDEHTTAVYVDVLVRSARVAAGRSALAPWEITVEGDGQCENHMGFLTRRYTTHTPLPPRLLQAIGEKQRKAAS